MKSVILTAVALSISATASFASWANSSITIRNQGAFSIAIDLSSNDKYNQQINISVGEKFVLSNRNATKLKWKVECGGYGWNNENINGHLVIDLGGNCFWGANKNAYWGNPINSLTEGRGEVSPY